MIVNSKLFVLSTVVLTVIMQMMVFIPRVVSLEFMIVGDWGKGGANGMTYNAVDEDNNDHLHHDNLGDVFTDENMDNRDNKNTKIQANDKQKSGATLNQAGIAKAMAQYASEQSDPPTFILSVGDNFYTKGVSSYTDPYWDYLWTSVYLAYDSLANIPWYPVLGNHDWGYGLTGVQAQVERTYRYPDGMWKMSSTNYSQLFDIGNGDSMLVLFCDTTTIAPSVNQCCNSKR
jgi:hypothetical protein